VFHSLSSLTYSGGPGPRAAGLNGDGAGPVSGGGACLSFRGSGRFGGSLALFHEEGK